MEVERPIKISVNGVVVDSTDGYQIELVLVAYQKGVNSNLLQIKESCIAIHFPIIVSLHFTESSNLCLTINIFSEANSFAWLRFTGFDEWFVFILTWFHSWWFSESLIIGSRGNGVIFVFIVGSEETSEDLWDFADHAAALRLGRQGLRLIEAGAELHCGIFGEAVNWFSLELFFMIHLLKQNNIISSIT